MATNNKFWGSTLGWVGIAVGIPAGLAAGAAKALQGGSFEEGFDNVANPVVNSFTEFGNIHSEKITGAVVSTAVTVLTGKALHTMMDPKSKKS